LDNEEFEESYNVTRKVSKQISGFVEYLKTTNILGQKFQRKQSQEARQFLEQLEKIRKK